MIALLITSSGHNNFGKANMLCYYVGVIEKIKKEKRDCKICNVYCEDEKINQSFSRV